MHYIYVKLGDYCSIALLIRKLEITLKQEVIVLVLKLIGFGGSSATKCISRNK